MDQPTSGSSLLTEGGNPTPAAQPVVQQPTETATPATNSDLFIPLDEDLKSNRSLSKFASEDKLNVRSLAKSYANLEAQLGGDKVPVPKTDEDWDRWHKAAGRPDAPDQYKIEKPADLPANTYDEEGEKQLRTWAHQNGLNQKQFENAYKVLFERHMASMNAMQTQAKQQREEGERALRVQLGGAYDSYVTGAKAAVTEFADPEFVQFLDQSGLGNDPRMIRVFGKIGKNLLGDDKLKGAGAAEASPADLDKMITEHRTKYSDALYNGQHPEHDLRTRELTVLFNKRFAG